MGREDARSARLLQALLADGAAPGNLRRSEIVHHDRARAPQLVFSRIAGAIPSRRLFAGGSRASLPFGAPRDEAKKAEAPANLAADLPGLRCRLTATKASS